MRVFASRCAEIAPFPHGTMPRLYQKVAQWVSISRAPGMPFRLLPAQPYDAKAGPENDEMSHTQAAELQ
jgi:hypothetical protein